MSIMSDEVNFLVYRYLQESGYQHSAFSFGIESHVTQSNINGTLVPPGALVNLLQKGIQFIEGELCVNDEGDLVENLDLLGTIPLIDAVVPEVLAERVSTLYRIISQKNAQEKKALSSNHYGAEIQDDDESILLHGHKREVFGCAWHPSCNIVATGAADGIAGLWHLDSEEIKIIELDHTKDLNHKFSNHSADITCLTWNPSGKLLATASTIDNSVRVWCFEGNLIAALDGHKDTVMSLHWNEKGTYLLSASLDMKCIIWNVASWQIVQEFCFHSGPVTDVDWQNENTFASCSTDKLIYVCKIENEEPVKTFQGHLSDINCVQWDPSATVLASCSDDKMIKLWSMKQLKESHDLVGHAKEITQIKWSSNKLLASASYDASVRIWDTEQGVCLHSLTKHEQPVNSISWHPDGDFLVSGALDGVINIWNTKNGTCVYTKRNTAGVFEVQWSPDRSFICVCQLDSDVKILDVRKLLPS